MMLEFNLSPTTDKFCQSLIYLRTRTVSYYILEIQLTNTVNIGDQIDYSQRKDANVGDLIQETLELLEQTGGEVRASLPSFTYSILGGIH